MARPKHVPGWCPWFEPSCTCYLSGCTQSTDHIEYSCKSETNCMTCGNFEAWKDGRNYTDK